MNNGTSGVDGADDFSGLFFACQTTPASCVSKDAAALLKRCQRYDAMGFTQADSSACCDSAFAQNGKARECVYFRPNEWTARRISIFPVPNSPKPQYSVQNWAQFASVDQIDIARVSVKAIDASSFAFGAVTKLSIVDADLESIATPPAPKLHVIDLSNNRLKTFPSYLFSPTHTVIEQLNIYGNPWQPSIVVEANQCDRLKVAAETGHITGLPIDCSCAASSPACKFPTLSVATSTAPPSVVPSTTSTNRPATASPPSSGPATSTPPPPTTIPLASPSPSERIQAVPQTTLPATPGPNTNSSNADLNSRPSDNESSVTGTVLVIAMILVVVGLSVVAFILRRRRRHLQTNPHVLTGFEMVSVSSLNVPFDTQLLSKRQLLRKTSSSAILSSSVNLSSSVLGLSKHRSADALPVIPTDQVKLLHLIAGTVFIGKFNNEKVVLKRWDCPTQAAVSSVIAALHTIAQLEHPQLLVMHGIVRFGEYEVSAVAEYMQCGSLPRVLLKQDVALSWHDQVRMSYELASALAYMHSQPNYSRGAKCLTSRDVLVNASMSCKLDVFDFLQSRTPVATPEFTYGGTSLAWEAPEVLTHNCARSSAAEMYSLGVILGEIVTRARPYQASIQTIGATATDIRIRDVGRPKHDLPHENRPEFESCPRFFKSLVAACLSRDVLRRPLAVNVAETLHKEMMVLKRNYG